MISVYVEILESIESLLKKYDVTGYIVGGAVRDLVFGLCTTQTLQDIDIVLYVHNTSFSNARVFDILESITKQTARQFVAEYTLFQDYYTSSLSFCYNNQTISVDYAITRKELYPYPASKPVICVGKEKSYTIYEDLYRRDFTINAMALRIPQYCLSLQNLLKDTVENSVIINSKKNAFFYVQYNDIIMLPYAMEDCTTKTLRITHINSFLEDPLRMLRLIMYMERYRCSIESNTRKEYFHAYHSYVLDSVSIHNIQRCIHYGFRTARSLFRFLALYMCYGLYAFFFAPSYNIYYALANISYYISKECFSLCSYAEREFLLYSILTHHSMDKEYMRIGVLYSHVVFFARRRVSRIKYNTIFYAIRYTIYTKPLYKKIKHSQYIQYIRSNTPYTQYALAARCVYSSYYKMLFTIHNSDAVKYHIARFCGTLPTRNILYLTLQYNIAHKIILEEYLHFKYTKKNGILFTDDELPFCDSSIKKELYQHVIASIFVYNLYTKEQQLQCALDIIHRFSNKKITCNNYGLRGD